ncbi:MAG TPA: hypothetical protein VF161_06635 [Steroidobacteraceae bacterium]|jgi:hypothetical protein
MDEYLFIQWARLKAERARLERELQRQAQLGEEPLREESIREPGPARQRWIPRHPAWRT